ncbi:MAG: clostripain-related cysteine peptidase [Desulfurococcales archaeon]|nr:clostripain-related cysteine peptidase [Desulfurococcales archaeon]
MLLQLAGPAVPALGQQHRSWTILVYMAADNDLEPFSLTDLDEIEHGLASGSGGVTVVALVDRSPSDYEYENLPPDVSAIVENSPAWSGARIVLVEPDTRTGVVSRFVEDWGNVNTGDPALLARFITYAVSNYPADHYALVIWDHGGGPGYFAIDFGHRDVLTLRELADALESARVHFDLIGFDACLMGTVEAAYEVRNFADYMVASEETEPGLGWPYHYIIGGLTSNPSMSPRSLATMIVDEYIRFYQEIDMPGVTLSAVDLSVFRDNDIAGATRTFIEDARNALEAVKNARIRAQEFGGGDDPTTGANQVDAIGLLDGVSGGIASAGQLRDLLESAIVSSRAYGDSVSGARGLSIHYPLRYDKGLYVEIASFGVDSGWAGFLEEAVNVEASLQPPQQPGGGEAELQLVKLFSDLGLEYAEWQAAGPVDFDGDGAQEFIVYGLGYDADNDEISIDLSISKYIDGGLVEVYVDTIDWGYPDEEGNSPFAIADAMSGDVDGDGMEEFFDAYSYVDPYYIYASVDRYDFDGAGGVESYFTIIDNLVVTSSSLGDLGGDGRYDIVLGGYEVDLDAGSVEGSLYLLSADQLEVEASFALDAPEGALVDVPGVSLGDLGPMNGDEIALAYNIYQVDPETGYLIPAAFRLVVLAAAGNGLAIVDGIEYEGMAFSLDTGDLDSDGQDEILIVYVQPDGGHMEILELQGSRLASLGSWRLDLGEQGMAAAEAYDIDGDGIMEIMLAVAEAEGAVLEIYSYMASTGELNPEYRMNLGAEHVIPVPTDLNGDSRLEIVYLVQLRDGVHLGIGAVENYVDPTGDIEGVVVDAEGNPVAGARVKLMLPRSLSLKTTTDENGRFNFTGVPAGTYQIEAYWRDNNGAHHAVQLVSIEAGQIVQIVIQEQAAPQEETPPGDSGGDTGDTGGPEEGAGEEQEDTTPETNTTDTGTGGGTGTGGQTGGGGSQEGEPSSGSSGTGTSTGQQGGASTPSNQTSSEASPGQQEQQEEGASTGNVGGQQQQQGETPATGTGVDQEGQQEEQQTAAQTQEEQAGGGEQGQEQVQEPEITEPASQGEQTSTGEGGQGLDATLAVQILILLVLAALYLHVRSGKRGGAAAIILLMLLNPAATALYAEAQHAEAPWWIYEGLRVTYMISSSVSEINPWASMQQTLGQMTVVGGGQVTYPEKPASVSGVDGADVYIVTEPARDHVDMKEHIWLVNGEKIIEGSSRVLNLRVIPNHGVYNGPFWIDPGLLRNARTGGTVQIPGEGRVVTYSVLYEGRVDISPESRGQDSLYSLAGTVIALPVPPGTYRDIVVLQGRLPIVQAGQGQANQQESTWHEIIVDKQLGLIYLESLITRQEPGWNAGAGGHGQQNPTVKSSLYLKVLSEVTLDLDNVKPPYAEYRQERLLHPGYHTGYTGLAMLGSGMASLTSVMFTYKTTIRGLYKDTMYVVDAIAFGVNEGKHAEIVIWKVDTRTGNAIVLDAQVFASTVSNQPITASKGDRVEHTYMWIGDDAGKSQIHVMGRTYTLNGQVEGSEGLRLYEYTLADATGSGFEIARLYYLPNGLLYTIEPVFNGISISEAMTQLGMPPSRGTALEVMTGIPNTQPRPVEEPAPQEPGQEHGGQQGQATQDQAVVGQDEQDNTPTDTGYTGPEEAPPAGGGGGTGGQGQDAGSGEGGSTQAPETGGSESQAQDDNNGEEGDQVTITVSRSMLSTLITVVTLILAALIAVNLLRGQG